PHEQLRGMDEVRERAETAEQARDIVLADHHAAEDHVFGNRWTHAIEVGAEQPPVERLWNDRASEHAGTRQVAAVVRMLAARNELHVAARREIIDRLRTGRQKGRAQLATRGADDERVEIAFGRRRAIVETRGLALTVAGDPQRAGRRRAGAANLLR